MRYFVKDFSKAVQEIMLIFGMQLDDDLLYHAIENQPSSAYSISPQRETYCFSSLYLSYILFFHILKNEILS